MLFVEGNICTCEGICPSNCLLNVCCILFFFKNSSVYDRGPGPISYAENIGTDECHEWHGMCYAICAEQMNGT